jgi:hypothetical protein
MAAQQSFVTSYQLNLNFMTYEQPVEKLSYFKATSIGKLYSSDILNDPVKKF